MVKHEIEIQLRDKSNGFWEPISFKKIKYGLQSIIVSGTVRILVNNQIVYPIEEID